MADPAIPDFLAIAEGAPRREGGAPAPGSAAPGVPDFLAIAEGQSAQAAPEPAQKPGLAEDVLRSSWSAVGQTAAGLAGLPRTLKDLTGMGLEKVFGPGAEGPRPRLGVPLPSTRDVMSAIPGADYQPSTGVGRAIQSAGPYVLGAALTPARSAAQLGSNLAFLGAAPWLASEGAGYLTQGTPLELPARIGAGLLAPSVAHKAVGALAAPFQPPPARAQQATRVEKALEVPLPPDVRSGSRALQTIQGTMRNLTNRGDLDRVQEAYSRVMAGHAGIGQPLPGVPAPAQFQPGVPPVPARAKELGDAYAYVRGGSPLKVDRTLMKDLGKVARGYRAGRDWDLPEASQVYSDIQKARRDLLGEYRRARAAGQRPTLPADRYGTWREKATTLVDKMRTGGSSAEREAALGLRSALQGGMRRSLPPSQQAQWDEIDRAYAQFVPYRDAIGKAPGSTLDPSAMLSKLSGGKNAAKFAASTHPRDVLARDVPNFLPVGTPGYEAPYLIHSALLGGAGMSVYGNPLLGAAVAAAPFAVPRAWMSSPVQAYLRGAVPRPPPLLPPVSRPASVGGIVVGGEAATARGDEKRKRKRKK